jgi:hypothetical protein
MIKTIQKTLAIVLVFTLSFLVGTIVSEPGFELNRLSANITGEDGGGSEEEAAEAEVDPTCTNEIAIEDYSGSDNKEYRLTSMGNYIEDGQFGKRWRIRNHTDQDTLVFWELVGQDRSGEFSVPAHSSLHFTSHFSGSASGGGTMKISVNGVQVDVKAHGGPVKELSECDASEKEAETGSSPAAAPVCSVRPVQLNLPEELTVSVRLGQPVVEVDWSAASGNDLFKQVKADIFLEYLETDPVIESTGARLKDVYSRYIFHELEENEAFTQAILQQAVVGQKAADQFLEPRGMQQLFSDYWPYIGVHLLKKNQEFGEVFLRGLLDQTEAGTPFYSALPEIAAHIKDNVQDRRIRESARCIDELLTGVTLADFIPGQGESVYGSREAAMQSRYQDIKEQGKLIPILEAIKNSETLNSGTKTGARTGIHTLLLTWSLDPSIRQLINYYETDEEFRHLKETFYETELAQAMEACVKSAFKRDLLTMVNEIRGERVINQVAEASVCHNPSGELLFQAVKESFDDSELKETIQSLTLNFLNDMLFIESSLSADPSFSAALTDYYNSRLEQFPHEIIEGMQVELYREGSRIYQQSSPGITRYRDESIPPNETGRVQYFDYQVVTRTECASQRGATGTAKIDPVLEEGTPINTDVNLRLKVKDGYDVAFMRRLENLLSEADEFVTYSSQDCDEARKTLIDKPTSPHALDYILACHSSPESHKSLTINEAEVVPPVLSFAGNPATLNQKTEDYLRPLIESYEEQYRAKSQLRGDLGRLPDMAETLLNKSSIASFTEDEIDLIICGGLTSCSSERKSLVERYFDGVSHVASVSLRLVDREGAPVIRIPVKTDLFGRARGIDLGQINAGQHYQVIVSLNDSPYTLDKIFTLIVNNAQPRSDGTYTVTIDIEFKRGFRYGNFDNSDEVINGSDITAWFRLLKENPELWKRGNLDGRSGIDLLDVVKFQESWGSENEEEDSAFTLGDLFRLFGLSQPSNASTVLFEESSGQTPHWLRLLDEPCR